MKEWWKLLAVASGGLILAQADAAAQGSADNFGPCPYVCFNQSLFSGLNCESFQLETFESGTLSAAGVSISSGNVQGPGGVTDSVDCDDGNTDGSGTNGRAWLFNTSSTTITFDATVLGALPTHVGFVWTDGPSSLTIVVVNAADQAVGLRQLTDLGDGNNNGGTAEDRFFGFVYSPGIKAIQITGGTAELDHLQFGRCTGPVPETCVTNPVTVACTLTPLVSTNSVGQTNTVTALVTTNNTPAAGVSVAFRVTGTNPVAQTNIVTDVAGLARFSYRGTNAGSSIVRASGTVAGRSFEALATNVWIGCLLDVPRLSQGDTRWSTNTYNHSTQTIRSRGCALTCLTMSLRFAGLTNLTLGAVTVTNDPGNLNAFMIGQTGDYVDSTGRNPGSSVNWANTTRDASNNQLTWRGRVINSTTQFAAATNYLREVVCDLGYPVSVKVNLTSSPSHYVLVTGWDGQHFTINDPGHADRTSLTNYNNQFETRGHVEPVTPPAPAPIAPFRLNALAAASDPSAFYVSASDNVHLLLTDPQGRRTGIDAAGNPFDEIPGAVHFFDEIGDDESDDPATSVAHQIYVDQPLAGDYEIQATGFRTGPYQLIARAFDTDGSPQAPLVHEDEITNGDTDNFAVTLDLTPPLPRDFAALSLKAPKKVTLTEGKPPKPGKLSIAIQNLGPAAEVIPDAATLRALLGLTIQSLGACPTPDVTLIRPTLFPVTIPPKKKLVVTCAVAIDCANDPVAGPDHADYRFMVNLNRPALDGQPDTNPDNNSCPRPPSGTDKGCNKGLDALTDVIVK